jgi:hypothetical protein
LSVVRGDDGSIVKVLSSHLHSADAMSVLAEMVSAVEAQAAPPEGIFVVGSGVEITSVKEHLQDLVNIPVRAPEESGLALARGAALAAANAPTFDATTAGLAYSLDPEGATSGNEYGLLAGPETMRRAVDVAAAVNAIDYDPDLDFGPVHVEEGRKPFLLVGSALTSIFVVGVVALVISLAVAIRPTAEQRPEAGQAIIPNAAPPAAAPMPEAPPVAPPPPEAAVPAPAPPPAPETIKAPMPVVAERQSPPPRKVYVEDPPQAAPAPVAPPPEAPAPPPADLPPEPPVGVPPVAGAPGLYPPAYGGPGGGGYPQYGPQQGYPQYGPQQGYPQQAPWQQGRGGFPGAYPGGGGGGFGGGRGGYGGPGGPGFGGGHGPRACILIFCTGGRH